jgi:signal peptidase I
MTRSLPSRTAALAASAAMAGALWWLVRTTVLITTSGVSMLPSFHTGDLAVVRRGGTYHVGEVVAYHSATLHTIVMHRIVAVKDGLYTFKGDHNSWLDPDHPTRSQLIGRLWLHVPHGGLMLSRLRSPAGLLVTGLLLALASAAGLTVSGFKPVPPRSQKGRPMGNPHPTPTPPSAAIRMASGCVAGLGLLASVVGFTHPASVVATQAHRYSSATTFSWQGMAPHSAVYPDGSVAPGQPVYTRLVPVVTFVASRRVTGTGPGPATASGTSTMYATVSDSAGWSRTFVIAGSQAIASPDTVRSGRLDLRSVSGITNQVAALTGDAPGSYQLAISLDVVGTVRTAGRVLPDSGTATSYYTLNSLELVPQGSGPGSAPTSQTTSGGGDLVVNSFSWSQDVRHPGDVSLAGRSLHVARLRVLGLVALFLGLLGLGYSQMAEGRSGEAGRIRRRYGSILVPMADHGPGLRTSVWDVATFDALARLAQAWSEPILHVDRSGRDEYFVSSGTNFYRYAIVDGAVPRPAAEEGISSPSEPSPAAELV